MKKMTTVYEEMEKVLTSKMKKELLSYLDPTISYMQLKEISSGNVSIKDSRLLNLDEKYHAVNFRKATLSLALLSEEHRVRYLDLWDIVKNTHNESDDAREKQQYKALLKIALDLEKLKLVTLQSSITLATPECNPSAPQLVEYSQRPIQEYEKEEIRIIIKEWEDRSCSTGFNMQLLNDFIKKYETAFLSTGAFIKDIRVKEGQNLKFRENLNGVLGIVSMNIEILRNKIK